MGEMKSAWEIAQERASRLGKLSPEEERRQKEEECRETGSALARRWLEGREQTIELANSPEEQKEPIKRAILEHMIEAIDLKGLGKLERIIQGITMSKLGADSATEQIKQLAQEYEEAKRERIGEIEREGREILHQMRISGTAVGGINIEAAADWQKSEEQWIQSFTPRLDNLKQTLLSDI